MDDRILAIISNTTVVAEACYHQNCYCLNTKSEEDKNTRKNGLISDNLIMQKKKVLQIKNSLHSSEIMSYNKEVTTVTDLRVRLALSIKLLGS